MVHEENLIPFSSHVYMRRLRHGEDQALDKVIPEVRSSAQGSEAQTTQRLLHAPLPNPGLGLWNSPKRALRKAFP